MISQPQKDFSVHEIKLEEQKKKVLYIIGIIPRRSQI